MDQLLDRFSHESFADPAVDDQEETEGTYCFASCRLDLTGVDLSEAILTGAIFDETDPPETKG